MNEEKMKTISKLYVKRISPIRKYYNLLSVTNQKFIKNQKIYHPLNPSHPFNIDLLNIKEISKRNVALLINNKSLKDKILNYRNQQRKNLNKSFSPNKYFYNKFKDEEKNYQLTIRAILKGIDIFPSFLSVGQNTENKKKKKINLKTAFSRNAKFPEPNKMRFYCSYTQIKSKNLKRIESLKKKGINEYISRKRNIKTLEINKYNHKNLSIKMKLSPTLKKISRLKIYEKTEDKINIIKKHLSFSVTNMKSKKLGTISIFGVLEDIGLHGKAISSAIINYLIDYFNSSKEMNVNIEKNNFYSILHWAFINTQNYLINNQNNLKVDLLKSGCMVTFLIVPKNGSYKIYCANAGICKCKLYSNRGSDIFSFPLTIDRPSEKDRIYLFHKKKQIDKILKNMLNKTNKKKQNNEDKKDNNNNTNNKNNNNFIINSNILNQSIYLNEENKCEKNEKEKEDNKDNNDIKENENEKENQSSRKEKIQIDEEEIKNELEQSIKYFKELGFTRCLGMVSGENYGLVPSPEINECDLKSSKIKYIILGNITFWKVLSEQEVSYIASKYAANKDIIGVNKELGDLLRQKIGTNPKILDKCGFEVVYLDNIL